MEIIERKSVYESLQKFEPSAKSDDFIEVTEWTNGEGWDINIGDRSLSLTMEELDAINYLTAHLMYNSYVK